MGDNRQQWGQLNHLQMIQFCSNDNDDADFLRVNFKNLEFVYANGRDPRQNALNFICYNTCILRDDDFQTSGSSMLLRNFVQMTFCPGLEHVPHKDCITFSIELLRIKTDTKTKICQFKIALFN